jgi:tetratricopeptide (TPR) repeat protein
MDPRQVAHQTNVDLVVSGTLMRMGDRLQVTAELTDGRDGTRVGSFRTQAGLGDLFDLQEELAGRIVGSLRLPLTARERARLKGDVPATARAYELYLRATELGYRALDWSTPRDMYLAALEEDPTYAPAWARLGRCYWLLGKHERPDRAANLEKAQAALEKALALNPDLDLAHSYAAQLETDLGRAEDAMVRLLERLKARPRGVDLLIGLVQGLRYCGLLDESLAAHAAARAIDPSARTSVVFTHFIRSDFVKCLESSAETDFIIKIKALMALDRDDEAAAMLKAHESRMSPAARNSMQPVLMMLEGRPDLAARQISEEHLDLPDPEMRFFFARVAARLGLTEMALMLLSSVVTQYAWLPPTGADPWLDPLDRGDRYRDLLAAAAERRAGHRRRFERTMGGRGIG